MRCKLPLFVTLFTLALISQSLFASTDTTVGSCTGPGTYYATISEAVTAASSGATIDVCPGTYPEQVTISKNLTLRGIKNGTLYAPTIVVPSGGLAVNGTNIGGESRVRTSQSSISPWTAATMASTTAPSTRWVSITRIPPGP